ncbi:MAG: hypothetical protein U0263_06405 [Polyangiaceae bacterium]
MDLPLPPWFGDLSADPTLTELGIRWLDASERQGVREGSLGVLRAQPGEATWSTRGTERLERCTPLGLAPERKKRLHGEAASTALFFDPERPDQLLLSLGPAMSPLTWAECQATPDELRALFARYFRDDAPSVQRLPKVFRSVVELGDVSREQLESVLSRGHPLLDDAHWYSAHVEDPWPADLGSEGFGFALRVSAGLRDAEKEHPTRLPSVSRRTLFSRSIVKLEQHPDQIWVVEIRYAPDPNAATAITWVNEIFRCHFPPDLPADVVGSGIMLGGHFGLADVAEREARGFDRYAMAARLALEPTEPATQLALRMAIERVADVPDELEYLVNVAAKYRHLGSVAEIALRVAGSDLGDAILEYLRPETKKLPSDPESDHDAGKDDDLEDDDDPEDDDDLEDEEEEP